MYLFTVLCKSCAGLKLPPVMNEFNLNFETIVSTTDFCANVSLACSIVIYRASALPPVINLLGLYSLFIQSSTIKSSLNIAGSSAIHIDKPEKPLSPATGFVICPACSSAQTFANKIRSTFFVTLY